MSSEGEATASGFTAEIAAIAKRESYSIDSRLEVLLAELDSVRAEKRKIDSVLKALNGSVAKPGPKQKAKAGKPFHISPARREQALAFITDNESEITSLNMADAVGVSSSYTASILATFREEGLVRLAATSGSLRIYRSTVSS